MNTILVGHNAFQIEAQEAEMIQDFSSLDIIRWLVDPSSIKEQKQGTIVGQVSDIFKILHGDCSEKLSSSHLEMEILFRRSSIVDFWNGVKKNSICIETIVLFDSEPEALNSISNL